MAEPTDQGAHDARLDRWRRRAGLFGGPIVGLLGYGIVQPLGLSPEAERLAGVLAFTITYWVCEPIPLAATALLGPLLCVAFGVADAKKMFAPFGSSILFLFIGTFILAGAAARHGLDKRIALRVLAIPGVARSPTTLLLAVGGIAGFVSMWTSNTATTAVITPIVLRFIHANPAFAERRLAAGLLLMISFAATAGGLATPIGTPPNLISIGFIEQLTQHRVTFVEWMQVGLPLSIFLIVLLTFLLRPRGAGRLDKHNELTATFRDQARALGPMSRAERNIVIAFAAASACWLYPGLAEIVGGEGAFGARWLQAHLPEDMVGLGVGLVLFLMPIDWKRGEFTVSWRDAARIDWGTIFLFGGGMALGQQIFATGLAKSMSEFVFAIFGQPGFWGLLFGGIVLSIALSEAASNTAAANVMVPLMIGLAQAAGLPPIPIAIATALACSFGFMLPVSTAPNAIVYGTGFVPLRMMFVQGAVFDAIGALVILAAMWIASTRL